MAKIYKFSSYFGKILLIWYEKCIKALLYGFESVLKRFNRTFYLYVSCSKAKYDYFKQRFKDLVCDRCVATARAVLTVKFLG